MEQVPHTDAGAGAVGPPPRRSLGVAALGTIIEWYDFSLYLYLAPIYARVFFGGGGSSGVEGLIQTFGVFAVAYLARPVGAIVFGRYGDRSGRRQALLVSAAIIAAALALNAAIPSEERIGVAAPLLLLLSRLIAGFAIGAEYSGILSYLMESADRRRRGLITSLAPAMSGVGTLAAVGITALVAALLDQHQLDTWGWRIPVAVGALLAAAMLLLRRGLGETPEFRHLRESGERAANPLREALRTARPAVLFGFVISAVGSVGYYLDISYVPTYLDAVGPVSHQTALNWGTVAAALVIGVSVLAGWCTDAFGRRPTLLFLAAVFLVTTVPLFALLGGSSAGAALFATLALATPAGAWSAACAVAIPEQLPGPVRFTGLALGYNTAVAIFGGLTPLAATVVYDWTGAVIAPAFLILVVTAVSIPFLLRARETAGLELSELDHVPGAETQPHPAA